MENKKEKRFAASKKTAVLLILTAFVFLGSAGGCGTGKSQVQETVLPPEEISREPAPAENPPAGDSELHGERPDYAEIRPRASVRDELTVIFSQNEIELDFRKSYSSHEAQIYTALYEGLFSYHPLTMQPVLAMASRWELSEDKKQWTFTIRESARYSNGDQVKAGDFKAAWLSLLEAGEESPYSSLFDIIEGARTYRLGITENSGGVGVSAPDDRTLVVRLNSPAAYFPYMLCHHSFSPVHPSLLENQDWSKAELISNGPFRLSESNAEEMILIKNEHYWDSKAVALNRLILAFTENGDDAAALWNSGSAHWISGDVNPDALTDRSGISVDALFATHYYFISSQEPWDDYRIRRALALALPWDEIRKGYYLPAETLIYPIPGYPKIEGLDSTDTEEARRLLEEAGYPKGVGLPTLVIRITPSADAERVSSLMAGAWFEKLGIPVKIDVVSFNSYFQSLKGTDYQVGFTTWIGDFLDPYTFLQMWRRDSNLNHARFSDDEYEALMEQSMLEEGIKRWETLAEAEKLLLSRGSVLPICYSPAVNIVDTDEIEGWYPNALDIHPFKYLAFKNFRPLPGVAQAVIP